MILLTFAVTCAFFMLIETRTLRSIQKERDFWRENSAYLVSGLEAAGDHHHDGGDVLDICDHTIRTANISAEIEGYRL